MRIPFADLGHFTDRNRAKQPMTPEKARDVVDDCLKLCKKISEDARKYIFQCDCGHLFP